MDDIKQDVTVDSSPTTTETPLVVTPAETTPAETTQSTTETTQTPPVGKQVEAVDEFGVPYKNRAFEWKRKTEELTDKLPDLIKDAVSQSLGSRQAEPQYTVEQLEQFATQTTDPYHATWAKGEIRRLESEQNAKVVRTEIQKWKEEQKAETIKQQSFQFVAQNYPDAFLKDANGNNTYQFNSNHPLTQIIGQLMQDPDLKRRPDGLAIAAELADARYRKQQIPAIQKEQQTLQAQVKHLQKGTLVEGGKQAQPSIPAHRAAIDRLKQTGSIKDATEAVKLIMKARMESQEE